MYKIHNTPGSSRKNSSATLRLKRDYLRLKKDPVPYVVAEPLPNNILEWHYVVRGPEDSVYAKGIYHGMLVFPQEFPYKPPSIFILTPNGRFKTNTRLCLSNSDFHPDTWNPAWSVGTILTGFLSFMLDRSPTLGSIETSDYERKQLALQSLKFNLQNHVFVELFPEIVLEMKAELEKRKLEQEKYNVNSNNGVGFRSSQSQDPSPLQSCLTNLCVVIGFAAFAMVVKYVLTTIAV